MDCYNKTETILRIITMTYSTLFLSYQAINILPLLQTVYRVNVQGETLGESYILPFRCILPFEIASWTRYSLAFTWAYASISTVVAFKALVSSITLILCFYATAVARDLQIKSTDFNLIE